MSQAIREPVFLAAVFLGISILASAMIVAVVTWKSQRKTDEALNVIGEAITSIRDGADERYGSALDRMREHFERSIAEATEGVIENVNNELDELARAAGLVMEEDGWVRPTPPPPVFSVDDLVSETVIGSAHLVTQLGYQAALRERRDYAPLPIHLASTDPKVIAATQDEGLRQELWNFILWYMKETGSAQGVMPWDYHPRFQVSWYEVVRAVLIDRCGWAMYLRIEQQFPPLKAHAPYLDWKASQPR